MASLLCLAFQPAWVLPGAVNTPARQVIMSENNAAKAAWLAKQEAPTWVANRPVEASGSVRLAVEPSSGDALLVNAKDAWLQKLDAPTWGNVEVVATEVATQIESGNTAAVQTLQAMCDEGDKAAR